MLLKLKADRNGSFKRNARDEADQVVRRYEWNPGVTLEIHADDLTLVGEDILNGVLIPVEKTEDGQTVEVTLDADRREQLTEALADAHDEANQRRLAFTADKQKQKDARRKPRPEKTKPAAEKK